MHKNLFIIRHAKSSWDNFGKIKDVDRPLNLRGIKAAHFMSKQLIPHFIFDKVLSSNGIRALHTAAIFIREMNLDFHILEVKKDLFHASSLTILENIKQVEAAANCVALLAHNPGITDFARQTKQEISNVATTGILHYQYKGDWKELSFEKLQFIDYDFPRR